jgi:hypothetical protein
MILIRVLINLIPYKKQAVDTRFWHDGVQDKKMF